MFECNSSSTGYPSSIRFNSFNISKALAYRQMYPLLYILKDLNGFSDINASNTESNSPLPLDVYLLTK